MYKVILIDDEPLARQLVKTFLKTFAQMEVVAECANGFEGFKAIQELQPDLIFLDVQMPRLNGMEMLELIENPPAVIFTTAFDEYAMKAFEMNAADYLLKPVTRERFDKAIKKWLNIKATAQKQPDNEKLFSTPVVEGYQNRIVVKDNGMIRIIPEQNIQYVEASDDYIKIVTPAGTFLKKNTLSHLEQTLDPQKFVRVHRSYLLPVAQLARIEPYEKDGHIALLQNGAKIPVSKSGMAKLKALLGW
jgi:two-component system LytT family response regulator